MEHIKKMVKNFSFSRLIFSIIFSLAIFYMNKIVFLGMVYDENYMELIFLNEFAILFILVPIFYLLLTLLEKFYKHIEPSFISNIEYKNKKLFLTVAFIFLLIIYLVYYFTFYPGGVYIDTWTSLQMLTGEENFTNHQPILYTLSLNLVKAFSPDLITGFGIFTFIQVLLMVGSLTYFLYWLLSKKINPLIVGGVTLIFAFFNLYPMYSISVWKDTPFSLALFLYTLTFIDLIFDFKNKNISIKNIIKFNIFTILVIFLRNNGIYITLISLIFLILAFIINIIKEKNIKYFKTFSIISFLTIILSLLIVKFVYPMCGIKQTEFVENLAIPIQQICRTVATDGNITDSQKELIEKVLPIKNIKENYKSLIVDPIKWDDEFNEEYLENNKSTYLKLWLELLFQNPDEYLRAFLLQTSGFWSFNVRGEEAFISPVIWETLNEKMQNRDLIAENINISFREDLLKVQFYSGGFFFWIMALSAFLTFRLGEKKALLAYIPALLLWATVIIATPMGQALRYVYILVLLMPFNILYPFIIKKKEQN